MNFNARRQSVIFKTLLDFNQKFGHCVWLLFGFALFDLKTVLGTVLSTKYLKQIRTVRDCKGSNRLQIFIFTTFRKIKLINKSPYHKIYTKLKQNTSH